MFMIALIILGLWTSAVQADEAEFWAPPIDVIGFPSSAEEADSRKPVGEGEVTSQSASGGIQRDLFRSLPVSIQDGSRPGAASSLIGLGRSAEETEIEALGVPLNSVQGGGFDLSLFPQFLWSGFSFYLGPSAGGLDPKASSGVLRLRTRTEELLTRSGDNWGGQVLYSSAHLVQIAAHFAKKGEIAIVAGGNFGSSRGPAVGLSGRWASGRIRGSYHLLAAHVESDIFGSQSLPTPGASQRSSRLIPVTQVVVPFVGGSYQSSFFYDWSRLDYLNPDPPSFRYTSRSFQFGLDQVLRLRLWRLALNLRQVGFDQDTYVAPAESTLQAQVGYVFQLGSSSTLEPAVRLTALSRYGARPGFSVAATQEGAGLEWSERISWLPRFPSLLNRYYVGPFFEGNPGLQPEEVTTVQGGVALHRVHGFRAALDTMAQYRQNALVATGVVRPYNSGWAASLGVLPSLSWNAGGFSAEEQVGWAVSRVSASGRGFPLVPALTSTTALRFAWSGLRTAIQCRAATQMEGAGGERVSGYGVFDVSLGWVWNSDVEFFARIDDVLDRKPSFFPDFPTVGRVISLAFRASFE